MSITRKNILVVDDDEDIRTTLRDLLEEEGYVVSLAVNGLEALKSVGTVGCNIILMDVLMPEMNGVEALRKIKGGHPDVKVIMMTGFPKQVDMDGIIEMGAEASLIKPFSISQLIDIIENE